MENITAVKKFALQEAGGFVSGIVTTEETELTLKITFEQDIGGQQTSMIFEKRTGLLLWANTSFGSYFLEMSIEGYSPWASAEEVIPSPPNPIAEFLPYIAIISISAVSALSLLAVSKVNKKIKKWNKYFLIAILAVASFTSFFIFYLNIEVSDINTPQVRVTNITLIVDYGNGTLKTQSDFILADSNTTAFHALQEWCEIEYEDYGQMGILVENIDGVSGNWRYSINGEFPGVSSNKYNLKSGDTVEWVFG
jgi:hypothetical protein